MLKSLAATTSRFLAHTRFDTAKTVVAVMVASVVLFGSQLVMAAPPTADFDFTPGVGRVNEAVSFSADVSDEDNDIVSVEWDFEDDGTIDDTGVNVQHAYTSPGTRTVRMVVTDAASETALAAHTIRVNAPPAAAFDHAPSNPSVGDPVDFDASSSTDDAALSDGGFDWDLDDDGSYDDATGRQISHSFGSAGSKTVGLRVTDSEGESDTASDTVNVAALNAAPQAAFDFTPSRPNPGQSVSFDGSGSSDDGPLLPTAFAWDLDGDGSFDDALGETPTFSYGSPGTRTISLRVTDAFGVQDIESHSLTVNAPPVAAFDFSPSSAETGESVSFDASDSSDDTSLSGSAYAWDFQDDGSFDATGEQVDHSFTGAGTMTVRLRVTDSGGLSTTTTRTITIAAPNSPPQPSFILGPTRANVGQPVGFDAAATTDDEPLAESAFQWDFDGDGDFDAQGRVVGTTFSSPGSKTVTLRVTDADGASATTSRTLTVNPPPSAAFDFSPSNPDVGDPVSFNAAASTDDLALPNSSYAWDLDNDGAFDDAVGQTTSASFATSGSKTVRLQVTDSDGATDVATETVAVAANPAPAASFTFTPPRPNPAAAVAFSAAGSTDDEPIPAGGYAWDFDNDGAFDDGTGQAPSTSFATAGAKTVRLQVTDADGATGVTQAVVTVNAAPTGNFTFSPTIPQLGRDVSFNATGGDDLALPAAPFAWDLDNDGAFDDGLAAAATFRFTTAGTKTVRLRITDSGGLTTIVTRTLTVNRPPVADFSYSPLTPRRNQQVTFTSTSRDPDGNGTITAHAWDLDNDGQFDDGTATSAAQAYATAGVKTVRLRVTDNGGATSEQAYSFEVQSVTPTASFTISPGTPIPGQQVTFTSSATPSPGAAQITAIEWDFDGISGFDATGAVAKTVYRTAGTRTVTLKVTDSEGFFYIVSQAVAVNAPPIAALRFSPGQPYVGDPVNFASVSTDVDGPLSAEAWDLDGDGQYDDARGKLATRSFATAGSHTVRLRVADTRGAADVEAVTVNVRPRPVIVTPQPTLNPVVRIRGVRGKRSTLIRTLSVRALKGAKVTARCYGKGCPTKRARSVRSKGKTVRLRWLERRLRAGTRIAISITYPGRVGKYTSFVVRRSKLPARSDLCIRPAAKKPSRCAA
ncbi:MAG TPA: PKD domain-containing protein [Thermoleophilaceae bacterium]|nr:PKD domain-containing protein [Thermoleophilaceae bacterium]